MIWPPVINIKSDGSQLTFVYEKPKHKNDKELFGMYEFTVSKTMMGKQFPISESNVKKMVERNGKSQRYKDGHLVTSPH